MATFALVHGAWHGGWIWGALLDELEALGHRVLAPDLPCEEVGAGVAEYAAVVADVMDRVSDAVVVGHSLGGMTIPLVPARALVYLTAYVPQPGRSLSERGPEAFDPEFGASIVRDELDRSHWPDLDAAVRDLQYPPRAAALAARLRRQAPKPSREPSPISALPDVPCAYILCTRDRAIPPRYQRQMAREELHVEPIELDSGHAPMLSCPGELAETLHRLASRSE
jgi:pimeloyl-ACP methyl ester carboxylesterase